MREVDDERVGIVCVTPGPVRRSMEAAIVAGKYAAAVVDNTGRKLEVCTANVGEIQSLEVGHGDAGLLRRLGGTLEDNCKYVL